MRKMEGEEKSKKGAKEKRSVKKSKAVALPAKEIPAAAAAKPSPKATAVPAPAPTATVVPVPAPVLVAKAESVVKAPPKQAASKVKEPTFDEIQLQAYFIGERRKKYGIPGDDTSDWVEAELTLKAQYFSK